MAGSRGRQAFLSPQCPVPSKDFLWCEIFPVYVYSTGAAALVLHLPWGQEVEKGIPGRKRYRVCNQKLPTITLTAPFHSLLLQMDGLSAQEAAARLPTPDACRASLVAFGAVLSLPLPWPYLQKQSLNVPGFIKELCWKRESRLLRGTVDHRWRWPSKSSSIFFSLHPLAFLLHLDLLRRCL